MATDVFGGAQDGFNWQAGRFVLGIEVDVQAADVDGTADRFF